MITRMQMPRQLRNKGGITNAVPREKYGLGSKLKERFRKLIPNELADVAVAAAPFVAPFNPGIAGLMRGIGRFDQRGSISDALKQGIATFGFGKAAGFLGGAEGPGGMFGKQTFTKEGFRQGPVGRLFQGKTPGGDIPKSDPKITPDVTETKGIREIANVADKVFEKAPILKDLPSVVKQKLLVGGITSGASALYSYFTGEFEPPEPGESMEEYMARRRERVKAQVRQTMDSYYTPLRNPEYAAMTPEQKDNFIDGIVGSGMATGGRVGYQTGGITMANTLAENIRRNLANQAAVAEQFRQARKNIPGYVEPQRTPVQEYAMGEDSILGPLSKKAASTIIEGQDKSRAALDLLNKTNMQPSNTITQTPTTDTAQIPGTMDSLVDVNKQPTQTTDTAQIPRAKDPYYDGVREAFTTERLPGGELFGDAIPGFDKFGTYTGDDPFLKEYYESGRGTPSSQLVKLPANNPYADGGAGYYQYNGTSFNKVADENPTPESMKFLRSNYLPASDPPKKVIPAEPPRKIIPEEGTIGPITKLPIEPDPDTPIDELVQPIMPTLPVEPMTDQQILEGFAKFKEQNPRAGAGPGLQVMIYGRLPDGTPLTFSNSAQAAAFSQYLESIGQPPFERVSGDIRKITDNEEKSLSKLATGGMPVGIMRTNKAGVMERDYRDKGGFVPVGIKEKADDVPAMLSKNEFVFTADAVRGAGNGNIEKGAQKMYDTMKKLEKRVV